MIKKAFKYSVVAFSSLLLLFSSGCVIDLTTEKSSETMYRSEITALFEQYEKLWEEGDVEGILDLYRFPLTIYQGNGYGKVTRDEMRSIVSADFEKGVTSRSAEMHIESDLAWTGDDTEYVKVSIIVKGIEESGNEMMVSSQHVYKLVKRNGKVRIESVEFIYKVRIS